MDMLKEVMASVSIDEINRPFKDLDIDVFEKVINLQTFFFEKRFHYLENDELMDFLRKYASYLMLDGDLNSNFRKLFKIINFEEWLIFHDIEFMEEDETLILRK